MVAKDPIVNESDFIKSINDEFKNINATQKKPNILVIGGTGVGKSSLINHVFGEQIAVVGTGEPVTQSIGRYERENVPVVLYDTKGYEIGAEGGSEFSSDVIDFALRSKSSKEPIHIAWYCIQATSARFTDFDIQTIRRLRDQQTPVAIVITKAEMFSEEESKKFLDAIRRHLPAVSVYETSTQNTKITWQFIELCRWSIEQLPEAERIAFVAAQKSDLGSKREYAIRAIKQHSAGAFATGFTPIPVSDAPLLVANQLALVARILHIYNLQSFKNFLSNATIASLVGQVLARSGMYAASQLLKMIPGIGTILGGTINGAVAGSITYALGLSVIELCEQIIKSGVDLDGLSGEGVNNWVSSIIVAAFNRNVEKV
jgi:predicted GTPase